MRDTLAIEELKPFDGGLEPVKVRDYVYTVGQKSRGRARCI